MPGKLVCSIWMIGAIAVSAAAAPPPGACHEGAFRTADGEVIAVMAGSEPGSLRLRTSDGSAGRLYRQADGSHAAGASWNKPPPPATTRLIGACGGDTLSIVRDGRSDTATRVPLIRRPMRVERGGIALDGVIVEPVGGAKVIALHVHGSERSAASKTELGQYLLPALGVGYALYDKRGTGASGGEYTQDFALLADDAAAALAAVRAATSDRTARVGLVGYSQGGWIGPLAAARAPADFVVAAYGLAVSPAEEDALQVQDELRRAGHGPEVLAKAREVTAATAAVIGSRFRSGYDELARVKKAYGNEPWLRAIEGEYSGSILRTAPFLLRSFGPKRDSGTPWRHDPLPPLRAVDKPMLWILAGDDDEAPSGSTLAILRQLQGERPLLDIAVFPATTHGILRFRDGPDGRVPTGYAPSYARLLAGWLKDGSLIAAADVETYPGSAARR